MKVFIVTSLLILAVLIGVPSVFPDLHLQSNRAEEFLVLLRLILPGIVLLVCMRQSPSTFKNVCLALLVPLIGLAIAVGSLIIPSAWHRLCSGDWYEDKPIVSLPAGDSKLVLYECVSHKGEPFTSLVQTRPLGFGLEKSRVLATADVGKGARSLKKLTADQVEFNNSTVSIIQNF